jgi:hypothetical protein
MKKIKIIFCLTIVTLLIKNICIAQTSDEGGSLGVKFGANISNFSLKDARAKVLPGFSIGLFSSGALSKYFAIQPELNLNVMRTKITLNSELSNNETNFLMAYPEFTLLGVFHYNKIYFQLGPYISYLAYISADKIDLKSSDTINRENFYDIDYGFDGTIGYEIKRWDIGLRYNLGLFKIGKANTRDGNPNIFRGVKTSLLQLYAGYYF